jgi:starch synthase
VHDWHAAFYFLQRSFEPGVEHLQDIQTVFTIHNLAYQGTRPISHGDSSLQAWFPGLDYETAIVRDPHATDCVNPMALAIRSADKVSTVSPTYAQEICRPSDPAGGFFGGEGLEVQLQNAARARRLTGILNGCEYTGSRGRRPRWKQILELAKEQANTWLKVSPESEVHSLALERLAALPDDRPQNVLVSIGRLVRQKVSLFLELLPDGRSALEHIAGRIAGNGVLILLGSGEREFEQRVLEIAGRCERLVFLRGYSETLADPLYRTGDLFLMPSSFEPCGISQMLAMRAAQPCVVHGVGGLCDTVDDGRTGFVFGGSNPGEQAGNFVAAVDRALALKSDANENWQKLCIRAASERFDWKHSATRTIEELYEPEH